MTAIAAVLLRALQGIYFPAVGKLLKITLQELYESFWAEHLKLIPWRVNMT